MRTYPILLAALLTGCSATAMPTPEPTATIKPPVPSIPPDVSGTATALVVNGSQTRVADGGGDGAGVVIEVSSEAITDIVAKDCETLTRNRLSPTVEVGIDLYLVIHMITGRQVGDLGPIYFVSDADRQRLIHWLDSLLDEEGELCGLIETNPADWRIPQEPVLPIEHSMTATVPLATPETSETSEWIPGLPYNATIVPTVVIASEVTTETALKLDLTAEDVDAIVQDDCGSLTTGRDRPERWVDIHTDLIIRMATGGPANAMGDVYRLSDADKQRLTDWLESLIDDDGQFCGVVEANTDYWRDP